MKHNGSLWGSVGTLTGAVLAILALTKGTVCTLLLLAAFSVWLIWLVLWLLSSHERRRKSSRAFTASGSDEDTAEALLLRHVNHRILARLQAVYPDASWEWCVKDPVRLICKGGLGRIRVYGVDGYDYADIRVDRYGNLGCNLVKSVPLDGSDTKDGSSEIQPPNRQPVDPRIWYEEQGRALLERLVADLNSRGHSRLTLVENGDVCICENSEPVAVGHFASFPEKVYWPGLVKVLEGDGLAADETAQGIQVTW